MAWFRRRKEAESKYSPMLFVTDEALERHTQRTEAAGLKFKCVEERGGNTYETYEGSDPEKAKEFLRKEPVANDHTYILVETPDGTWGTDSSSLYLERLRPWQLDADGADCSGSLAKLIDGFHNLELAAKGVVDNFLVEVCCGRCEHAWIDGIRYNDVTLVRCPDCGAGNRVDSSGISSQVHFH